MLKNKDFKTIFCSAGNQCYQRKVVPQVNLVIPPVVNRLISVGELRAVAINIWLNYQLSMNFFATFFLRDKLVMWTLGHYSGIHNTGTSSHCPCLYELSAFKLL